MIESKFHTIQRSARAALSFYSKNNELPNKKSNKILNFLIKLHNDKGLKNYNINKKKRT